MREAITIVRDGPRWAIQHEGSVLGHARSPAEAVNISRSLVDWLQSARDAESLRRPRANEIDLPHALHLPAAMDFLMAVYRACKSLLGWLQVRPRSKCRPVRKRVVLS